MLSMKFFCIHFWPGDKSFAIPTFESFCIIAAIAAIV